MNIVYLTLTMFPTWQVSAQSHVSYLTAVLTSRILLDLHEVNRQLGSSESALALSSASPEHTVVFADRAEY
ncbi:hypothetical protein LXA43DRAFT_997519 [Ganoderma leucocontextum]|nr:hypothetical protein LXA43DRAFT_997519 [Ganoderma leucocontextum]